MACICVHSSPRTSEAASVDVFRCIASSSSLTCLPFYLTNSCSPLSALNLPSIFFDKLLFASFSSTTSFLTASSSTSTDLNFVSKASYSDSNLSIFLLWELLFLWKLCQEFSFVLYTNMAERIGLIIRDFKI